jgi:hypothetical protein
MTWHSSASNAPAGAEGDSQCPWNLKEDQEDDCPECGNWKPVEDDLCPDCQQIVDEQDEASDDLD